MSIADPTRAPREGARKMTAAPHTKARATLIVRAVDEPGKPWPPGPFCVRAVTAEDAFAAVRRLYGPRLIDAQRREIFALECAGRISNRKGQRLPAPAPAYVHLNGSRK